MLRLQSYDIWYAPGVFIREGDSKDWLQVPPQFQKLSGVEFKDIAHQGDGRENAVQMAALLLKSITTGSIIIRTIVPSFMHQVGSEDWSTALCGYKPITDNYADGIMTGDIGAITCPDCKSILLARENRHE